jgi:hypothetical protein
MINSKIRFTICFIFLFVLQNSASAQVRDSLRMVREMLDSMYIMEIEAAEGVKPKVLHAEPLYIDLIRDLGARKGEKEWNFGFGLLDNERHTEYEALVEYEWAPIDRLGLEVELPFSLYYPYSNANLDSVPQSRLNSLKLAAQYTFLVSEKLKTSLAIGYLHEFEMIPFERYGQEQLFEGNLYNPFFVAAKRWGNNFHTLVYTGPRIFQYLDDRPLHTEYEMHSNFHYMIAGTRNFIGVEFNKYFRPGDFDMTIRPQMRVSIRENLLIGIVTGIPIYREQQRFSTFIRLIYEPGH